MQWTLSSLWVSRVGMWKVQPIIFQRVFLKDTPLTWTFSINIYERNPSICSLPSLTLHSGAAPRLLVGAWTSHEFIAGPTQCNKQPPSLLKPLNTICVFSCNEFVFICILFNWCLRICGNLQESNAFLYRLWVDYFPRICDAVRASAEVNDSCYSLHKIYFKQSSGCCWWSKGSK